MSYDIGSMDERTTELSSIAAIYPEIIIDPNNPFRATLEIAVSPSRPLKIRFKQPILDGTIPNLASAEVDIARPNLNGQTTLMDDEHKLRHLPPLLLEIVLPEDYPLENPPEVCIQVTPQWLPKSKLIKLQNQCEKLWKDSGQDQILYTFIDYLEQAAEDTFGLDKSETSQGLELSSDLKLSLLDFDLKKNREKFESETFDCPICLEPKKGKDCCRLLLCGHVFCVSCLQDCFKVSINEGDVDTVRCLVPNCGKDQTTNMDNNDSTKRRKQDRTLNPSELMQIPIEQELVQRYVRLKRKRRIEADRNTIYCPRQWCQGAAKSKKHPKPSDPMHDNDEIISESEDEKIEETDPPKKKKTKKEIPMSERLAICEDCNFAFCSVCKKGWHGELSRCDPRRQAELDEEEKATIAYLQKYSTPCPTCNAPCQKIMGCNHMICFRCKTHFCYLCSSYLMPDNPYKHFNELKSTCYMRLWELEGGDGDRAGENLGIRIEPDWEPEESDSDSDESQEEDDDDDDFEEFEGDDELFLEEDTDDSEPAPDQRRPERAMQIEIMNFAREGALARRIELPQRPRVQDVPVAQNAVLHENHRHRRRLPNRIRNPQPVQPRPRRPPSPPRRPLPIAIDQQPILPPHDDAPDIDFIQAAAAPGQGNGFAAQQPAPVRAMGLERFLQLAQQDLEDEWDSDELDEEMEERVQARPVRRGRRH